MFSCKKKLKQHTNKFISAEISDASIRLLEIYKTVTSYEVIRHLNHPVVNSTEETLRTIVEQENLAGREVITALPYGMVYTQNIGVPKKLSATAIEQYCRFTVAKHLNLPQQTLSVDYQLKSDTSDDQYLVEVVAAPHDKINNLVKCFTNTGLLLKAVEVDHLALERASRFVLGTIINIAVTINFYKDKFLLLALNDKNIIYSYEHTYKESAVAGVAQHTIEALEICWGYIHEKSNTILLAGENPNLDELVKIITARTNTTVKIAAYHFAIAPEFCICFGMCLRLAQELSNDHY